MRVQPDVVEAGERVEVQFADGVTRGVAFVLELRVEGAWALAYWMTSAPESQGSPSWGPAEEDWQWIDLGVSGPSPDLLEIPETVKPGIYRICTANRAENICAQLRAIERHNE